MANMNQLTKRAIEVERKCPTAEKNGKFNDACRAREARQENACFTATGDAGKKIKQQCGRLLHIRRKSDFLLL